MGALVALFLSFFVGNRFILAPINQIGGVMRRWKAGEVDARMDMKPSDELRGVGSDLDDLLDELDAAHRDGAWRRGAHASRQ